MEEIGVLLWQPLWHLDFSVIITLVVPKMDHYFVPKLYQWVYSHTLLHMTWTLTMPWHFVFLRLTENKNTSDMTVGWKLKVASQCQHWTLVSSWKSRKIYHGDKCLSWSSNIWRNKEYVNYSILFCTTYLHIEVINIFKTHLHKNNTCLSLHILLCC